jgi:FkbM family methyltransferase
MAIFANEHIGLIVNQYGVHERDQLAVLFEFLEPLLDTFEDGIAVDVGAKVGNHAVHFSRHFRQVHAFEPDPDTYRLLTLNAEWSGGIVTHPVGLSDTDRDVQLHNGTNNSGRSRVVDHPDPDDPWVSLRTLDGLELPFDGLELVKIDIEGHESAALRGAEQTIRAHHPIIVFEQHGQHFDGDESETIRLLRSWDYEICWHRNGSNAADGWRRRLTNIIETVRGTRDHRIETGTTVPARVHEMLIAVPPCHLHTLSLRRHGR